MTTIPCRIAVACSLALALIPAPGVVHAQGSRGGRGGPASDRSAPPATSRPSAAAKAAPVQERVAEELEAKYKQMAEALDKPVPKRDFEVATGEPVKVKLFRADPKLIEKKFVATVILLTASERPPSGEGLLNFNFAALLQTDQQLAFGTPTSSFGTRYRYPDQLLALIRWDGRLLNSPGGRIRETDLSLSEHHKLMLEQCAAVNRPSQAMVEFLTSEDCDRDVTRTYGYVKERGTNGTGWTFRIYGNSAEESKARVAALLQLIDGGVSRPMRQYFLTEGHKQLESVRTHFAEVAEQSAAIRVEEDKLVQPSEISSDILSQLKAQKVMVAVELSGLSARVKACDEMLKDPKKLEISTLQSISDMKVKAEIERVGIKEKLDQINTFIAEGDQRQAAQGRIIDLRGVQTNALNRARSVQSRALSYAGLFDLYAPLPLKDNQITISPVEWTN